jgi:uncharacterized PurR-regulated membrane protein YhhQ (DUF165 family)
MQYKALTKTSTGRSGICVVDDFQTPFNIGIAVTLSATATFTIEYSLDDPLADGYSPSTANWFVAPGFTSGSAAIAGALTIPCRAICINVSANTGTVTANIVQAGPA